VSGFGHPQAGAAEAVPRRDLRGCPGTRCGPRHRPEPAFRRTVKWRAGCEGRISALKRGNSWDRTRLNGTEGARILTRHGIVAHNPDQDLRPRELTPARAQHWRQPPPPPSTTRPAPATTSRRSSQPASSTSKSSMIDCRADTVLSRRERGFWSTLARSHATGVGVARRPSARAPRASCTERRDNGAAAQRPHLPR
jgi:hypothetical protein